MGNILKGRNAVVTGSSMGIGKAIALALAAEGAKVVVNSSGAGPEGPGTNLKPLNDVVDEIKAKGGVAIASFGSVGNFAYTEKLVKTCVDNFGSIDIVVNCAGNLRDRMMINMSEEEWDAVVDVHLKGTFSMIRHAAPYMREKRFGRIINFTSNGWLGNVGQVNYSASKGGIVSMTYTSALELGSRGITANCIAPGAKTRMTVNPKVEAGIKKKYEAGLLSKSDYEKFFSMPGPEYVAPFVVYLCTDQAGGINGQVFGAAGSSIYLFSKPQQTKTLFKSQGIWTVDELIELVPGTVAKELINPAPPKDD
jgi:NAD(P)-dependent dehydrogenase (short-subunit alcohol dehydrogenase family)